MRGELRKFFFFPDITATLVLLCVCLVITAFSLQFWTTYAALVVGILSYWLSEYTTHRFVFHMQPPKSAFLLRMIKRLHYDHHTNPADLHLLFLPIWYSWPLAILISLVIWLVTHRLGMTFGFASGLFIGLLFYEWTHFVAHRPIRPKTRFGKWQKRIHLWHHFKNENYWYGVTHPGFDFVFNTFRGEKDVPKSATARNLEERGETARFE